MQKDVAALNRCGYRGEGTFYPELPMESSRQPRSARGASRHVRGPGAIIRSARASQGMTLAQLGAQVGYSAAQVSRYERGVASLTNITVLRRFAAVLDIEPRLLGLSPADNVATARHAVSKDERRAAHGNTVVPECQWEDGDDPVRRRELLATLAGAVALGAPSSGTNGPQTAPVSFEELLYSRTHAAPVSLPSLRNAVDRVRDDFRAARYDRLPTTLPRLIAAAQATSDEADSENRAPAKTLLAETWILAADFAVKVNDDPVAWLTAGRALQAAQAGDDPLTLADARRTVATAMRRSGYPDKACNLLVRACHAIEPAGNVSPDQIAMYGNLLNVAAYTAATSGNRGAAAEFGAEATEAAVRLGPARSRRIPAFTAGGVTLYQVSIAQVLGDNGTAIEHARRLRPAEIPTVERQGRYWVDVARAYHQWGKPEACYSALLA